MKIASVCPFHYLRRVLINSIELLAKKIQIIIRRERFPSWQVPLISLCEYIYTYILSEILRYLLIEDGYVLFIIRCILVTRPIIKVIIETFFNVYWSSLFHIICLDVNAYWSSCEQRFVFFWIVTTKKISESIWFWELQDIARCLGCVLLWDVANVCVVPVFTNSHKTSILSHITNKITYNFFAFLAIEYAFLAIEYVWAKLLNKMSKLLYELVHLTTKVTKLVKFPFRFSFVPLI